jgi:ribonuclease P protein component
LRRRADFDRVFQQGRHNSGRLLALRSVPNDLAWSRFAYAVPKRVGKAVVRNRIRRRLREILRLLPFEEGFDVVISVRAEAAESSFFTLKQEVQTLMRRARLLAGPVSPPAPSSSWSASISARIRLA